MNDAMELTINTLTKQFVEKFGRSNEEIHVFFAPGRMNLIGEYTDFTGGLVFPCGISQGTTLHIRHTGNKQFRFASTNFDLTAQLDQQEINQKYMDTWINYPLGVLDQFSKRGVTLDGFDCLYSGNVPNGAGLSSSASIEVVTAFALNALLKTEFSLLDLVKISQAAENDFVGMQCGIMDQFAVAFAQENHAIKLDCHSLEHRQVPLNLNGLAIVVTNTNQRRELNDSAYNDRVGDCRRALSIVKQSVDMSHLAQLTPDVLAQITHLFKDDPLALNRAKHICEENARVRAAVPALESGNIAEFGRLMNASHDSLRDLFNVSSEPLNRLVALARQQDSVIGSRLTGAGFGGCTVSVLPGADVENFKTVVGAEYTKATGLTADFYSMQPGKGVRAVKSSTL